MVVTEGQTGGAVGPAQRLLVPMHSNLTIIKYCNIVIKFFNIVIIIIVIIIVRMVVTELQTGGSGAVGPARRLWFRCIPVKSRPTMNQNQTKPPSLTWIWISIQMNQDLRTTKTPSKVEEV